MSEKRFKVTASRVGQRSKTRLEVDASGPLAAAVVAFGLVADGAPEVVEFAPLREASSSSVTVFVDGGVSARFRMVVEPATPTESEPASGH